MCFPHEYLLGKFFICTCWTKTIDESSTNHPRQLTSNLSKGMASYYNINKAHKSKFHANLNKKWFKSKTRNSHNTPVPTSTGILDFQMNQIRISINSINSPRTIIKSKLPKENYSHWVDTRKYVIQCSHNQSTKEVMHYFFLVHDF